MNWTECLLIIHFSLHNLTNTVSNTFFGSTRPLLPSAGIVLLQSLYSECITPWNKKEWRWKQNASVVRGRHGEKHQNSGHVIPTTTHVTTHLLCRHCLQAVVYLTSTICRNFPHSAEETGTRFRMLILKQLVFIKTYHFLASFVAFLQDVFELFVCLVTGHRMLTRMAIVVLCVVLGGVEVLRHRRGGESLVSLQHVIWIT